MQAWENFLNLITEDLGKEAVDKWLRTLKILSFDAGNLALEAADAFQISWFEEHVRKKANKLLLNNNKRKIKLHLLLANSSNKPFKPAQKKEKNKEPVLTIPQFSIQFDELNPLYTFDNYIGSQTHPLPHRLLFQLTGYKEEQRTELATFNPVYLWGQSGTGKTHLLSAAAHELRRLGLVVAFVRSETFTEHVVTAIRAGEMSLFRESYRNVDVLIIDDVQIFAKKWATQEELFHTFNTLHLAGKQMILSANCSPSELQHIEPRLISRFEWGIVLPMGSMSKEDSKKILQSKAQALNYSLNQKVMDFLVDTFSTTKSLCRALEALVLRTHLNQAKFASTQLSIPFVQQQLTDLIAEEQETALNPTKIIQQVSEYFGIRPEDILGKAQSRDCVLPRQIAMHLCRSQLQMPFTKIGDLFDKDHSTVMSSVKTIQKGLEVNKQTVSEPVNALLKKLNN